MLILSHITALGSEVAFLKSADQVSGAALLPVVIQGHGFLVSCCFSIVWNTVPICVLEASHHGSRTGRRRRGGEAGDASPADLRPVIHGLELTQFSTKEMSQVLSQEMRTAD